MHAVRAIHVTVADDVVPRRGHPGATGVPPTPARRASPWITLSALRVLRAYRDV
jgi:hypothetical protein